jgi:hypothetical protein
MGVFDFLRRDGGTQSRQTDRGADDGKTITIARKPGTLYYLRARNVKSGFDDVLCFESDIMRRRYIGTARESTPYPADWYFNEWETSAEERLQQELENQRQALEKSYKQDIAKLEYKIRGLQSDCRNLQAKTSTGTWQEKYNNELYANSIIKRDLQEERQKNAELLALIQQARERKEHEQAQQPEQAKTWARKVLAALDLSKVQSLADSLQSDPDFAKSRGNLQGRLIAYYANKIINT